MEETLPSAPAVVLPIIVVFLPALKAIDVYSAWLWVSSLTSTTSFP